MKRYVAFLRRINVGGHVVRMDQLGKVFERIAAVDSPRTDKREVFAKAQFQPARLEKLVGKPATFRNINTIRRIAAHFVKPCLVLALMVPQGQKPLLPLPASIVTYRVALLRNWSDAVLKHEPGIDDEALTIARQWSRNDLQEAWLLVNILIRVFERPQANRFTVSIAGRLVPVDISARDRRAIQDRAELLAGLPGRNSFLKRAAVYHTDLALLGDRNARRTAFQPSFLLPSRMVLETTDGRHDGTYDGDVHWEFARVLLDGVTEVRKDDAVAQWYRATLSHKLAVELLDIHHFGHGLRLFPEDPEILFLNGSLHDLSADPRVQTVRDELRLPPDMFLDIKPEEDELRLAEGLFRRTLEHQADHVEARLRHGRVLDRLGRTSDAVVALRLALEQAKEPLLQYYALIFLGTVEQKLNRLPESQLAFERAAALFPDAPAPRLGLSQLAYRAGDRVRARELLEPALASDGKKQTDPWWSYRVTPGRRTAESMEAMYRALTGAP